MDHPVGTQSFRNLDVLFSGGLSEKEFAVVFGKQLGYSVDFSVAVAKWLEVEASTRIRRAQRWRNRALGGRFIFWVAERNETSWARLACVSFCNWANTLADGA